MKGSKQSRTDLLEKKVQATINICLLYTSDAADD